MVYGEFDDVVAILAKESLKHSCRRRGKVPTDPASRRLREKKPFERHRFQIEAEEQARRNRL